MSEERKRPAEEELPEAQEATEVPEPAPPGDDMDPSAVPGYGQEPAPESEPLPETAPGDGGGGEPPYPPAPVVGPDGEPAVPPGMTPPSVPEEGEEAAGEGEEPATEEEEEAKPELGEMTLLDHLRELRVRITRALIAFIVGGLACYNFKEEILDVLMLPMLQVLHGGTFIYTYPAEAFFTYLKAAFVAGFFLVSPYIFYQAWKFVAPGLYEHERKFLIPIAFFTAVFFAMGSAFGYFVVFPYGFEFFAGFTKEYIEFMPRLEDYFNFAIKLLFAFGLIFELPVFTLILSRMGLVTATGMRKFRKYAIILTFVVAAILTPPDAISQCLMAGPMLVLYEVSILVAQIFGKSRRKEEPAGEPEDEPEEAEDEAPATPAEAEAAQAYAEIDDTGAPEAQSGTGEGGKS